MENSRAFVCGASQGIGQAIAKDLAESGVKVTVFARSPEKLEKLCQELPGEGHDFIAGDIGQPEQWMSELEAKHSESPYSILICNSGGPKSGPISQAQPEEFLSGMQNHLIANSLLTRVFLEAMKEKGFGRIITVTSTSVKVPIPHLGVSNTVRAAVSSWAKTLSLELAPYGITVNNVMPGFTKTPRLESLMEAKAKSTGSTKEQISEQWKNSVPMKRFGDPSEIAALVGFLSSGKANYITGQNIAVDGGRTGCL